MHRDQIVNDVLKLYGGAAALAGKLGVSRQAVWQWKMIPLRYVALISKEKRIPRKKLRPDIYA